MKNGESLAAPAENPQVATLTFGPHLSTLKSDVIALWQSTCGDFPQFEREYSQEEQLATGEEVERTIPSSEDFDLNSEETSMLQLQQLKAAVRNLVVRSVDRERREITDVMLREFSDAGDEFVRKAHEFDPGLEVEDVFQALRNLWIMNSMQVGFGLPVRVTPSGLAYSLLYPYLDNYLDDPAVTEAEKREFSRSFRSRLSGLGNPASSRLESKSSDLVGMIESEFPRSVYPDVYESLLAIHRAQEKSLQQHVGRDGRTQPDVLDISAEKGGASVLADAYLVKGWLAQEEAQFAFGYGVFLQFIDDLQDVDEDLRNGHQTLFTLVAVKGALDGLANRLFRFLNRVLESSDPDSFRRSTSLDELVRRSCHYLILESIALNSKLFSDGYVGAVERYSPIRFDHIRTMHGEMKAKQKRLRKVLKNKRVLSAASLHT